ncbi:MAG: small multi-drug export protein [Ruminococcaceae bacterium]|nr:small multi-drug export protein [Oscillospiraceae bacterium]
MAESLAPQLAEFFGGLFSDGFAYKNELIIFIISMLPILELRGGLIAAALLKVELIPAMVICFIGNILPIPIILLFVKRVFAFMKKHNIFVSLVEKLENRGKVKGEKIQKSKWEEWALMIFVAIPLPGTGGWTGALIASLLNMDNKKAFKVITIGVAIAGILVAVFSYGLLNPLIEYFK